MKNNNNRNFIWNTIGTTIFSFNSLFLMIAVTRINGVDNAGIFSFAFSFACIMNAIALFSGRTYQVTDNSKLSDQTFIITRILTSGFAMLMAVIFIFMNGYHLEKAAIIFMLCLLKCVEAISDVFYGIIQKNNNLYLVGKSMAYKSIIGIIIFLVINYFFNNLFISCLFLVIINVLFLFFYDIPQANVCKTNISRISTEGVKELLRKSFYTFLFTLIVLIIINIPKYAIDFNLENMDQAVYGIISMPATFMMLLGQFILQPVLIKLNAYYKAGDKHNFNLIVVKMSFAVFIILIIILPVAYILGIPILEYIYTMDLSEYRIMLLFILMGAACYAISNIILNALITLRYTKEQFILQIIVFVLSVIISIVFTRNWGLNGSIMSYVVILFLQFIFYVLLYISKLIGMKSFKGEILERDN